MSGDTRRGRLKKSGAQAAKEWLVTAAIEDIAALAGCGFEYSETLDALREDDYNVPSSSDKDFSWGFFKRVKSHVYCKLHKDHKK